MADIESDSSSSSDSQYSSRENSPGPASIRAQVRSSLDLAKEEIICPMCIGVFNTPRSLQCLHSYCEDCIESLLKSSPDKTSICCPECRADTVITSEGVQGLPINFKLKRFVEVLTTKEKQDILTRSYSIKQAQRQAVLSPTEQHSLCQDTKSLNCSQHSGKVLEYYCEECAVLICGKCMLERHRHHEGVEYASDILPGHITKMLKHLATVNTTLTVSKTMLDSLHSNMNEIKKAGEEAATTVKGYFDNVHRLLREREAAVLEEIDKSVSKKEKIILRQQQQIQEATNELQKCMEEVSNIEENRADDVRVLREEKSIRNRVEDHKNKLELVVANIKIKGGQLFTSPFNSDAYFEAQCKTIGEHPYQRPHEPVGAEPPCVENTDFVPPLPPDSRPRQRTLPMRKPSHSSSTDSLASFQAYSSFTSARPRKDSSSSSLYDRPYALYDRPRSGPYDNDEVILLPCVEITPKQLLGASPRMGTVYPNGVCIGKPDSLIVTDSRNGILRILTPTGKCLDSVILESKGDGNMVEPTAVTTNEEGIIFVIIKGTSCKVQKYSPNGVFQSKLKAKCHLGDPTGITVLPNGNVLITDSQKNCVHQFDGAGKYQGKLGIPEAQQPNIPADITHDHRGNLIIADRGNHSIWIYTLNGRYVRCFGTEGSNQGELSEPYSVAADLDGYIYVAESGNHRISVFNLNGKFVRCFGKMGSEAGMFHYPRHLCVDSLGRLVVADEHNQRLQIFDQVIY